MAVLGCGDSEIETLMKFSVSQSDIQFHENRWKEVENSSEELSVKFKYAWCLLHSQDNVKKAITLFEELFKDGDERIKRDSIFYLALGHAKLKNYIPAKKYTNSFLSIEPENIQAKQLLAYIQKHLKSDGLTGMAIVAGLAVVGGITAVAVGGIALAAGIGATFAKVSRSMKK